MTSRQAKNQEDTHARIMHVSQNNPDLSRRKLSELLGMSAGVAELPRQRPHRQRFCDEGQLPEKSLLPLTAEQLSFASAPLSCVAAEGQGLVMTDDR
jgi:hypothetical protein